MQLFGVEHVCISLRKKVIPSTEIFTFHVSRFLPCFHKTDDVNLDTQFEKSKSFFVN